MKRYRAALLLCLGLLLGCSGGKFSDRSKTEQADALTYALNVAPTTLDPAIVQDIETSDLLQNVFGGLVQYGPDNRLEGALAETWTVSPDGRTYTFRLREAKFHDGTPVTAEDVVATFRRNLAPEFNSPTAINYLSDIVGASAFHDGKAKEISGLKAEDPRTVAITIDEPRAYFLGKLAYPCAFVLPKSAAPQPFTKIEQAIGTGPFRFDGYVPDQQVTLTAFADFFAGAPKIARIVRPIVLDPATRLNKFRSGELDLLTVQRQEIPAVEDDPALKSRLGYQLRPSVFYVGLMQPGYAPFRDVRVRQALAHLVDRTRITQELLRGLPEARGLVPPGVPGFETDLTGVPFDPAKAKALLAAAGFPNGRGLPPLRITYRVQTPDSQVIAEAIANTVRQHTEWTVRPTGNEWSAMLAARNKRQLAAYVISWYGDYLDPQNFLSFLLQSDSPQNRDGFADAEFDALTRAADVERDSKKRTAMYRKAAERAVALAARIPVYYGRDAVLTSDRIAGVRVNLFGNLPHVNVEVK